MNKFDAIFIKNTIKNKRKDRYTLATVKNGWLPKLKTNTKLMKLLIAC